MHRRTYLAVCAAGLAGCATQDDSAGPTATETGTETPTQTPEPTPTPDLDVLTIAAGSEHAIAADEIEAYECVEHAGTLTHTGTLRTA